MSQPLPDTPHDHCLELLEKYPDLQQFIDENALRFLNQANVMHFERGTLLFSEASPCRNFMWLIEGTVRVFKNSPEGREMTLYRVEPGDLCLLSLHAMFGQRTIPASAEAVTPIRGLVISAEQFRAFLDRSQTFRDYVIQTLAQRLTDVIALVSDIAFRRLDLRLACFLGSQFERSGGQPLRITHFELAQELGTSREVISRILKEFERQQCISLSRGMIHLVSQEGLEWFTKEDKE